MIRGQPKSTPTYTCCPYATLVLSAWTLCPGVQERCGARGEAESKLSTQEEREHVGNDRNRSRDPASCCGRVRPRISHRPGPLCRGGSLQDDPPGDPSMAARFLRNQCLSRKHPRLGAPPRRRRTRGL